MRALQAVVMDTLKLEWVVGVIGLSIGYLQSDKYVRSSFIFFLT